LFCRLRDKTEAVGKTEGPVILALAALGPALSSKRDTDEDPSPSPPHFIMLVDLYKSSGSESYYSYSALVDSSATYNFIS
jgi:hypothetical protein